MMKIIRITTDNEIDVLDFPKGTISEEMDALRKMIGDDCRTAEHVMPRRLYSELKASAQPSRREGSAVSMLVDEDGIGKVLPLNVIGSYLYETDRHGNPILGNILIIGEYLDLDGISFSGLDDRELNRLLMKFRHLAELGREPV